MRNLKKKNSAYKGGGGGGPAKSPEARLSLMGPVHPLS